MDTLAGLWLNLLQIMQILVGEKDVKRNELFFESTIIIKPN